MAKAPLNIRSLARSHTESGIRILATIAAQSDSDAARIAAIGMLLDRGWGKPASTFDSDGDADIRIVVRHIICGQREPKLIEQGNGREKVGEAVTRVLPSEGENTE